MVSDMLVPDGMTRQVSREERAGELARADANDDDDDDSGEDSGDNGAGRLPDKTASEYSRRVV